MIIFPLRKITKTTSAPPALKIILDDAAKMKTLIGSLDYNLKRLKEVKLDQLDEDSQKFLKSAIENYEWFTRGVNAVDKLRKITDDEYTLAWAKDAGLSIFTDAVIPAVSVIYPAATRLPISRAGPSTVAVCGKNCETRNTI